MISDHLIEISTLIKDIMTLFSNLSKKVKNNGDKSKFNILEDFNGYIEFLNNTEYEIRCLFDNQIPQNPELEMIPTMPELNSYTLSLNKSYQIMDIHI